MRCSRLLLLALPPASSCMCAARPALCRSARRAITISQARIGPRTLTVRILAERWPAASTPAHTPRRAPFIRRDCGRHNRGVSGRISAATAILPAFWRAISRFSSAAGAVQPHRAVHFAGEVRPSHSMPGYGDTSSCTTFLLTVIEEIRHVGRSTPSIESGSGLSSSCGPASYRGNGVPPSGPYQSNSAILPCRRQRPGVVVSIQSSGSAVG